ncbi:hypothetical protein BG015_002138 [Linnemannia schmuckeri]|uniref:Arrestin-like N-terminal domain-containing protein n=1 Tax=Linnemannia schmuckeri TaxID=64567 RepID=A0A9P5VDT2_9FUNG|nr:hypothetical protein BG015_002138 [Linnemannia schmuckeri]
MSKSKPLSMKNIARAPSSTKDKRLSIEVHSDNYTTINNRPMPVFFSNLEAPAVIRATVTFENDQDCQGQDVEINYKAAVVYEATMMTAFNSKIKVVHNIQRKRWTMSDLVRPSPGTVAAGKYTKIVTATIDPLWPSSGITSASIKGMGWIRYTFEASFVKMSLGASSPVLATLPYEVWVVNSILPSEIGHLSSVPKPLTAQAPGKKPDLPVSLTIPNQTLQFHEQVPLTVRVEPFRKGCKGFGQNIVVLSAGFSVREKVVGWTQVASGINVEHFRDVAQIAIREGWPQNTLGGWTRTVSITLPTLPEINASMTTKVMDISHSVLFTLKYKAENDKDIKAQEITVEVPFQLVVPRRYIQAQDDFLPTYSAPNAQDFQGKNADDGPALPYYAREE